MRDNTTDSLITYFYDLLTKATPPERPVVAPEIEEQQILEKLEKNIFELRNFSSALSKGELQTYAQEKGFVLSNLKALHANLRHLTWQTKQIAEGDFTQKVDFLGDFSDSFNEMTLRLNDYTAQLEHLANKDFLTGIPNRRYAISLLEGIFSLYKRNPHTKFSVLMCDIDYFKQINDQYGHNVGDEILIAVTKILQAEFRSSDTLCRIGGEEFLAILPDTGIEGASKIADRARSAVATGKFDNVPSEDFTCTISIGVSEVDPDDETYNAVITRSDDALYEAKESGRNRICANPEILI